MSLVHNLDQTLTKEEWEKKQALYRHPLTDSDPYERNSSLRIQPNYTGTRSEDVFTSY